MTHTSRYQYSRDSATISDCSTVVERSSNALDTAQHCETAYSRFQHVCAYWHVSVDMMPRFRTELTGGTMSCAMLQPSGVSFCLKGGQMSDTRISTLRSATFQGSKLGTPSEAQLRYRSGRACLISCGSGSTQPCPWLNWPWVTYYVNGTVTCTLQ